MWRGYLSPMDPDRYAALQALHTIFMVTFFAGTFYVLRMFVHHREALAKWEPDRTILSKQFIGMERRAWYGVTWPSFLLFVLFGVWMFVLQPALIKQSWMHAKLGLVALLLLYHFVNHGLYQKAQRNEVNWSTFRLRLWNMGGLLVLCAVVFLATIKKLDGVYGAIGLLVMGAVIVGSINMYRKKGITDAGTGKPSA
jgi:protoporphyrinogen IX oxidase